MKIEYITSNRQKFEEAMHILEGFELEQVVLDLTEIQGDRYEVIKAKAEEALKQLNRPLIVEDVSLAMTALKGLPGPYIKDFLKHLGAEGIYELVHKYEDHSVQAICLAAYIQPGMDPILFEGILEGQIVAPLGTTKHGLYSWNSIFRPEGMDKTFGELTLKELSKFSMRYRALSKLKNYLKGL